VGETILDAIPRTLMVFGTANLLFFFACIILALNLARKYGSWVDKIITALTPLGAAPSWVYGLILFTLMISMLHIGGLLSEWPSNLNWRDISFYLRRLAPPVISIFISKIFQNTYAWRTIFLLNSNEDYVEMARAKGVPASRLERSYILRPVLPAVMTSFVMLLVGLWQEVIVLEYVFKVKGIGYLFRQALQFFDVRMIVALVVTFAYLLTLIIFILDIAYAIVDPRVKIEGIKQASLVTFRLAKKQPRLAMTHLLRQAASHDPPSSPLLKEIMASQTGGASRQLYRYVLEIGRQLVEVGALIIPNEVLWLTRHELFSYIQDLQAGKTIPPLNTIIHRRRSSWELNQKSQPIETGIPQPVLVNSFKLSFATLNHKFRDFINQILTSFRVLIRYPSAMIGLLIILFLVTISIYTIITIPYTRAVRTWRGDNYPWRLNPQYAYPEWVNWFRKNDYPKTIILNTKDGAVNKTISVVSGDTRQINFTYKFKYPYREFPQDLIIFFTANYDNKKPMISLTWLTPDNRKIDLGNFSITSSYSYYLFQDKNLLKKLKTNDVNLVLFNDPLDASSASLPGIYELQVTAFIFEDAADIDAEFVLYGKVWGLAGTDGQRRDVMLALMWGTVVALSFGLLAAVGTTLLTLVIAAIGTWFEGWVDEVIQRITEINMILPFFPVILMIYILYSKSLWILLGMTVLLSIFGSGIKNYRSLFLQIKETPYIEAARAYGASDWRIIFRYLIPRIGSILIPQMVILVPSYVYLEAALSILGLYDPVSPPTWGQLILDGLNTGTILQWAYHMALEPAFFLIITGYGFLLLGTSLERLLEPRLRNI